MTDPRDLIQRLADVLDEHARDCGDQEQARSLASEARAYLATPEPAAGPTDEDLAQYCHEWFYGNPDRTEIDPVDLCRGALARYGHQPLQPIPLSARLPGPEDCDGEGRCWWWIIEQPGQFPHWIYAPREVVSWAGYMAWLPHYALPLPMINSSEES